MIFFAKRNEVKKKEIKKKKAQLGLRLRIILSLIWPKIKNTKARPILGILIKK